MGRCIIKIKDRYYEWSTVVDAPITSGMNIDQLYVYMKEEYGNVGIEHLDRRLEKVEAKGTSMNGYNSLDEILSYNRAGENESEIPADEIYERYVVTDEVK